MKCCGKERDGKFCNQCGEPLSDDPLYGLVNHCLMVSQRLKTKARALLENQHPDPAAKEDKIHRGESFQKESQKWHAWATALEARLSVDQTKVAEAS